MYHTQVFIAQAPESSWVQYAVPATALIFFLIQPTLFRFLGWTQPRSLEVRVRIGLALVLVLCLTLTAWNQHKARVAAARASNGDCTLVSGRITQFHPMPAGGHAEESFVVGGRRFRYTQDESGVRFHHTMVAGGPIRPGLPVQICYAGDDILRLDILRFR